MDMEGAERVSTPGRELSLGLRLRKLIPIPRRIRSEDNKRESSNSPEVLPPGVHAFIDKREENDTSATFFVAFGQKIKQYETSDDFYAAQDRGEVNNGWPIGEGEKVQGIITPSNLNQKLEIIIPKAGAGDKVTLRSRREGVNSNDSRAFRTADLDSSFFTEHGFNQDALSEGSQIHDQVAELLFRFQTERGEFTDIEREERIRNIEKHVGALFGDKRATRDREKSFRVGGNTCVINKVGKTIQVILRDTSPTLISDNFKQYTYPYTKVIIREVDDRKIVDFEKGNEIIETDSIGFNNLVAVESRSGKNEDLDMMIDVLQGVNPQRDILDKAGRTLEERDEFQNDVQTIQKQLAHLRRLTVSDMLASVYKPIEENPLWKNRGMAFVAPDGRQVKISIDKGNFSIKIYRQHYTQSPDLSQPPIMEYEFNNDFSTLQSIAQLKLTDISQVVLTEAPPAFVNVYADESVIPVNTLDVPVELSPKRRKELIAFLQTLERKK